MRQIGGFANKGKQAYFGAGSYRVLMQEIAKWTDRIQVRPQGGGGTGVLYLPEDEEAGPGPVASAGQ